MECIFWNSGWSNKLMWIFFLECFTEIYFDNRCRFYSFYYVQCNSICATTNVESVTLWHLEQKPSHPLITKKSLCKNKPLNSPSHRTLQNIPSTLNRPMIPLQQRAISTFLCTPISFLTSYPPVVYLINNLINKNILPQTSKLKYEWIMKSTRLQFRLNSSQHFVIHHFQKTWPA